MRRFVIYRNPETSEIENGEEYESFPPALAITPSPEAVIIYNGRTMAREQNGKWELTFFGKVAQEARGEKDRLTHAFGVREIEAFGRSAFEVVQVTRTGVNSIPTRTCNITTFRPRLDAQEAAYDLNQDRGIDSDEAEAFFNEVGVLANAEVKSDHRWIRGLSLAVARPRSTDSVLPR